MHLILLKKKIKDVFFKKKIYLTIFFLIILLIFIIYFIKNNSHYSNKKNNNINLEELNKEKPIKYMQIIKNIHKENVKNFEKEEKFIIENEDIYGTLVSFFLAKKYILSNELDKAFKQLNNSLKYTKEENLKNILYFRIAKIKLQQKKIKDAMQALEKIQDKNWISIVENLKGDIFMKNKKTKEAIMAWEKSKNSETSNAFKEMINMKINNTKQINAS